MTAFKAISLSAISTTLKIFGMFFVNKILAVYVGPAGFATIGQFQNFMTITSSVASASVSNGVVTMIAESVDEKARLQKVISTAFLLTLLCAGICSFIILLSHQWLTVFFLKNLDFTTITMIFGFSLIFQSMSNLCYNVLNGYRENGKLFILNMATMLFSLTSSGVLAYYYGVYGALLSITISPILTFFVAFLLLSKAPAFSFNYLSSKLDKEVCKKLFKFSTMAMLSSLLMPTCQIFLRNHIIDVLSLEQAGMWQAITKISDVYLLVITTSLSVYYLPSLSSKSNNDEFRAEVVKGLKIFIPLVMLFSTLIYVFRDVIITTVFSADFKAIRDLFLYQLMGDVLKIAAWLLGFILVVKTMTRWYFVSEIFFAIVFMTSSYFLVNLNGLIGSTQAFALSYLLYLCLMLFIFFKLLSPPKNNVTTS